MRVEAEKGASKRRIFAALEVWQGDPSGWESWIEAKISEDAVWRSVQRFLRDVFRLWFPLSEELTRLVSREPKRKLANWLRLAGTDLWLSEKSVRPSILNAWLEEASSGGISKGEIRFLNGVLRTLLRESTLTPEYSVGPHWLQLRWRQQFGEDALVKLNEWHRQPSPSYVFSDEPLGEITRWDHFFHWDSSKRDKVLSTLSEGRAYVQDPFTRWPISMLDVGPGMQVLDLCAAPGGKSWHLRRLLKGSGKLTAVDLPGDRLVRLEENLKRAGDAPFELLGMRLPDPQFSGGPYDRILLDVPCSNTGVIRRRPDVPVRLTQEDISARSDLQKALLSWAAGYLKEGGKLVYSTCSIEREENEDVVDDFLGLNPEYCENQRHISLPWKDHHDGGGSFCFVKRNKHS